MRGSALIAGEVTMLRSRSDVKFDTGDKEESGCLSANPSRGLRWVLVPSRAGAEEEQGNPVPGPFTELRNNAVGQRPRVFPMGQRSWKLCWDSDGESVGAMPLLLKGSYLFAVLLSVICFRQKP